MWGEVWKSVSGECGKVCWGEGEVWGKVRGDVKKCVGKCMERVWQSVLGCREGEGRDMGGGKIRGEIWGCKEVWESVLGCRKKGMEGVGVRGDVVV